MKPRGFATVIALGIFVSGCAIHPVPDDVTGLSTYDIVRQIRCETRQAVMDSVLGFLTSERNSLKKVDLASRRIGEKFEKERETNPDIMLRFHPTLLSGFARQTVGLLWNTGIAYNYNLEMLEINNFDPEINLLRGLPSSSHIWGLKGNFDRQRQNTRVFTITDNFGDLVNKVRASYCRRHIVQKNVIYPIAGEVGMRKVVQDFLRLTLFGNLAGGDAGDVTDVKGPPTMVDQLEFQTLIGGSVTPKVTFIPPGRPFHVADASLGISISRRDTHKLTVGLYLDETGARVIDDVRAGIFQDLLTATGGRAERGAARAVDQFLRQKIFQPQIIVRP